MNVQNKERHEMESRNQSSCWPRQSRSLEVPYAARTTSTTGQVSQHRGVGDNQRHGGRGDKRRSPAGEIAWLSSRQYARPCSTGGGACLGRRRFSVRIGRIAEDRARKAAQLTYVAHQRGQVGRIQDSSLVGFLKAISTLGENGLEGVCAGALDHANERPGIEDDR